MIMKSKLMMELIRQYKGKIMDTLIGTWFTNVDFQIALKKFYSGKEKSINGDLINMQTVNSSTKLKDTGPITSHVHLDQNN